MSIKSVKSLVVKLLLVSVVAAAVVAVISILIGNVPDIAWRALWTAGLATIHLLLLFLVLSYAEVRRDPRVVNTTNLTVNALMVLFILSFATTTLSTWDVIGAELSSKLFSTYLVALFSIVHMKAISDEEAVYTKLRPYVMANIFFILLSAGLIITLFFVDNAIDILEGFYGRALAATLIINVTISIVIATMSHMYKIKHPQAVLKHVSKRSTLFTVLAILVIIFLVIPFLIGLLGGFMTRANY